MIYELRHFTQLVVALNRPDIQTVDALLIRLAGDRVAGTMLRTLIYWMGKSVRRDGLVYKSWRHWAAECALSVAQVKRVHQQRLLEEMGVVRRLKKAEGAPTTHYGLDFGCLLERLAAFLEVTVAQVRAWLEGDAGTPKRKRRDLPARDAGNTDAPDELAMVPARPPDLEPPDDSPPLGDMTARQAWRMVVQQLQRQLDRTTFGLFVQPAAYHDCEPESGTLRLRVSSPPVREMLMGRLHAKVERMWQQVSQRAQAEVIVDVAER